MSLFLSLCMCVCTCVCACVCACVCVSVCLSVCLSVCVCLSVHPSFHASLPCIASLPQGNRPALCLVPVTMAGYLLTLLAKEIVAVDTIEVLQQTALDYMFMFKKADMDIISMTMMVRACVCVGS